jgi:hypothetical protein
VIVLEAWMWPGGDPRNKYPLGEMVISNDGTGGPGVGNYDAEVKRHRGPRKSARVEGFPRLRLGVWNLVRMALDRTHGPYHGRLLELTSGEASHLAAVLLEHHREGSYAGNRERYYTMSRDILRKLGAEAP